MRKLVGAAVVLAAGCLFGSASYAFTPAPLGQALSADVITIAGGCGRGFHRGPYGGCRPNAGGAVVVAPGAAVVVSPGPCGGRGRHRVCGPYGHCRWVCN